LKKNKITKFNLNNSIIERERKENFRNHTINQSSWMLLFKNF